MEYINDISIMEAVIHILDNNGDEPILNQYKMELNEDIYKFILKHLQKSFNDEELKYAVFNKRTIVKEVTQEFLNGDNPDFIAVSQELARQMFSLMKSNVNIPSCDLMVVYISTEYGPMLGILKMDYVKNFTHQIDFVDDKIGINIVPHAAGLPGGGQRLQKCAFIKPIREDQEFNIMVIDKQTKSKDKEEYGSNYFISNYLGCNIIANERDMTKNLIKTSEAWTRDNMSENADRAEQVRSKIKEKLKTEETININELTEEIFKEEPQAIQSFTEYASAQGLDEEITLDKQYLEKKLKRVRLKIDKDIDLYINEEVYGDINRFEIVRNGDGSINMIIKHVINYIEK
ncbi:nucleoid-associated protein [Clostridium polynesiense]|uniref:nucleoid-associated protein n=1 Tax=Clostridium polynesiense TaxID=1325933 RepID=UPI00058CB197|nr:nucleoid-associated protein [Clostridium polynesiense]